MNYSKPCSAEYSYYVEFLFSPTTSSDFLDDNIDDDVDCVKKIYEEHERLDGNGFKAW